MNSFGLPTATKLRPVTIHETIFFKETNQNNNNKKGIRKKKPRGLRGGGPQNHTKVLYYHAFSHEFK